MIARHSRRSMSRRGGFLTVLLLALPLMLVALSLAFDYSRAIYVSRQLADTAEAVVMAGATGFSSSNPGTLDAFDARQRARDMYDQAERVGMLTAPNRKTPSIEIVNGNRTVMATLVADVELVIPSALMRMLNRPPLTTTAEVTRRASVCQPTNRGGCMYPVSF